MSWTGTQDMQVQVPDLIYIFDLETVNVTGGAPSEVSVVGTSGAEVAEFFP